MDFSKLLFICLLHFVFGVLLLEVEGRPKSRTRKKHFSTTRKAKLRPEQPTLTSEEWRQLHRFEDALKTEEGELMYTNSWAVKLIDPAEVEVADRIALKHGFENLGQVNSCGFKSMIANWIVLHKYYLRSTLNSGCYSNLPLRVTVAFKLTG